MPTPSFNVLANANPQTAIAVLASGQNPDGTPFKLAVESEPAAAALVLLGSDGTLLGTGSSALVADWTDVASRQSLLIARSASGGTYQFEVDWSRDGSTVDVTEAVAVANDTSIRKDVAMPFVRLRVRNTSSLTSFTAHRTTVHAR